MDDRSCIELLERHIAQLEEMIREYRRILEKVPLGKKTPARRDR